MVLGGLGLLSSLGGVTGAGAGRVAVDMRVRDAGLMLAVTGTSVPAGLSVLLTPNCFWRRAMNSSSARAGREGDAWTLVEEQEVRIHLTTRSCLPVLPSATFLIQYTLHFILSPYLCSTFQNDDEGCQPFVECEEDGAGLLEHHIAHHNRPPESGWTSSDKQ